jgi:tRNA A37 threonylcarbamoyladenosine biosynthesis protein TsaE
LSPAGVAVIEWAERLTPDLLTGVCWRRVRIEITGEQERRLSYDDLGA